MAPLVSSMLAVIPAYLYIWLKASGHHFCVHRNRLVRIIMLGSNVDASHKLLCGILVLQLRSLLLSERLFLLLLLLLRIGSCLPCAGMPIVAILARRTRATACVYACR